MAGSRYLSGRIYGMRVFGVFEWTGRLRDPTRMPLSWSEVRSGLDPAAFTIRTVSDLLCRWRFDPWAGFREAAEPIPELAAQPPRIATTRPAAACAAPTPGGRVPARSARSVRSGKHMLWLGSGGRRRPLG